MSRPLHQRDRHLALKEAHPQSLVLGAPAPTIKNMHELVGFFLVGALRSSLSVPYRKKRLKRGMGPVRWHTSNTVIAERGGDVGSPGSVPSRPYHARHIAHGCSLADRG